MSERLVDLREILRGLHDHEVDYVLFGATAMLFYGFVRNTEDVDIVVARDEANLRRVHNGLVSIEAHLKRAEDLHGGDHRGDDGWFCAQIPKVPEAISQGRTLEEARAGVEEAPRAGTSHGVGTTHSAPGGQTRRASPSPAARRLGPWTAGQFHAGCQRRSILRSDALQELGDRLRRGLSG